MLTSQIHQLFQSIRKTEKPFLNYTQFKLILEEKQYTNLITNIMTYCAELKIQPTTIFLAKVYIDIFLSKSNFIDLLSLNKTALCCVWMAIKFNQPEYVSNHFSPALLCSHSAHPCTVQEIVDMEITIFKMLDYQLLYTTPYDVMEAFFLTFPWLQKIKVAMPDIIQLALTIPQLTCQSAENIFYAGFLAVCTLKEVELSEFQRSIVRSQIRETQKVEQLSSIVSLHYQNLNNDEMDSESDSEQTLEEDF